MATTKNKKKKKSRRYLTRAARRTVAALLMISALIVAAIPATPSRAIETEAEYEEAAGFLDTQGDLSFEYEAISSKAEDDTGLIPVRLKSISRVGSNPNEKIEIGDRIQDQYICREIYSLGGYTDFTIFIANTVKKIDDNAFASNTNITQFSGQSVEEIGAYSFSGCSSLKECNVSGKITSIGTYAFENSAIERIPSTGDNASETYIQAIQVGAFKNCDGLSRAETIVGPEDESMAKVIENEIFMDCDHLKGVTFKGCFSSIGENAFNGCDELAGVVLSNTMSTIGTGCFLGCVGLNEITLPEYVDKLPDLSECVNLHEIHLTNGPELAKSGTKGTQDILFGTGEFLPETATDGKLEVWGYRFIQKGTNTNVPTNAYEYCFANGITYHVTEDEGIAKNYIDIGVNAIEGNTLINIGSKYMAEDSNILTIPAEVDGVSIQRINANSFMGLKDRSTPVTSVTLPSSLTYIGAGSFGASGGSRNAYLPFLQSVIMGNDKSENSTIVEDSDSTFPNVDDFFIHGDMRRNTTDGEGFINAYEYSQKYGIEFRASGTYDDGAHTDVTLIVKGPKKASDPAAFTLTGVAEDIDGKVVKSLATSDINGLELPSGVEAISENLLKSAKKLNAFKANISVGNDGVTYGLRTLADNQFANCEMLSEVTLPSTLYDVGKLPFVGCESLTNIGMSDNPWCYYDKGRLFAPYVDGEENTTGVLSVQPSTDSDYEIAEWLEYYYDSTDPSGKKMATCSVPSQINNKNVKNIREEAFANSKYLTSFSTIGSNITRIPDNCFRYSQNLKNVTLDSNISSIGSGAFMDLGLHNNGQPRFNMYNAYYAPQKEKVFSFDRGSNLQDSSGYFFYSTMRGDAIYQMCTENDPSDNNDNLFWIDAVDPSEDTKTSLSECRIVYHDSTISTNAYGKIGYRKYTGSDITLTAGSSDDEGDFHVVYDKTILTYGSDFTMTPDPLVAKEKTTYPFFITGIGNFKGTLNGYFQIGDGSSGGEDDPTPTPTPTDTGDFVTDFSYDGPGFFKWTGSTIMPQNIVVRSASNNDIILTKNVDYTISYGDSTHDNKSMGINMGLVTISGINKYKGKTGKSYFSIKKSLSENIVGNPTPPGKTIDVTISNGVYDSNNAVSANIVLIDRTTGKTLTEGVDYTVTCTKISGKNQAIATITGMGDYYYDTYVSSRFAITKKKSSSSGSTSSSSGTTTSSSSSSGSSSSSSGSSSSSSSGSSSSSSSAGSSSAGGNYSRNTTSGSTVTRTSGGTVRAATDDELANLLQAAHIDAINGGTADGYQVRISKTDSAESAFSQALVNRYGSLDNVRYYSMDIELLDENGNYVDSSGVTVTMTLPLPDSLASYGANNRVATVDGSGNLEDLGVTYSMLQGRECATFVAPHFSPYGFYVDVANLDYGVMDSTPKTGDPISPKWFFSLGLAALSIFLFLKKDPKPKANPA